MSVPQELVNALKKGVTAGTLVKAEDTENGYEFTFHSAPTNSWGFDKISAQFQEALHPLLLSGKLDRRVGIAIRTWGELTRP